ncbi:MAG: cupin domain-containing protein [Planctomycetota bacterium]
METGKINAEFIAKAIVLKEAVQYAPDSVVSKTIIDKKVGTISLFAFDAGQGLSEHQAPYDAFVQVIDGTGKFTVGKETIRLSSGQIVIMPANIAHSVTAEEKFKMMLIMIRA